MKKALAFLTAIIALSCVSCSCTEKIETSEDISSASETDSDSTFKKEKNEDIVVTMAIMNTNESFWKDLTDQFNREGNGCKVELKNYNSQSAEDGRYSEEELRDADFQLIQDIINTDDIDIIFPGSFHEFAKFEQLKNKGAFADLYPFMENDPEINTQNLNSKILSLNETNGKLYALPTNYYVYTLAGKKEYTGSKENLTVEEFISIYEKMPKGTKINDSIYSGDIFQTLLRSNLASFIDYENASVNFDCDEFSEILEFCHKFKYNDGQTYEGDNDSVNFAEFCNLDGFWDAHKYFDDKNTYTMIGYPSFNGEGAYFMNYNEKYAISAKSSPEKQTAAWKFIRTFATEEYVMDNWMENYQTIINGEEITCYYPKNTGFPVNKKAFERQMEDIVSGKYAYTSDKGDIENSASKEECKRLLDYLDTVNKWNSSIDRAVWDIVTEETEAYLAGERSLEECLELMQNRATTRISEQS